MGVYFLEEKPVTLFDRIFRISPILPTIMSLVMIFTGIYYFSEPCPNYAAPLVNVLCGLTSLASAGILWLSNFGPRIGLTSFQIGTLWITGVLVGQFSQFVGYYQIMRGYDIRNHFEPYWQYENKTIIENDIDSTILANNYCPYVPMTVATISNLTLMVYVWIQICIMLRYIFKDLRNDFEESALDYDYEIVSDEE